MRLAGKRQIKLCPFTETSRRTCEVRDSAPRVLMFLKTGLRKLAGPASHVLSYWFLNLPVHRILSFHYSFMFQFFYSTTFYVLLCFFFFSFIRLFVYSFILLFFYSFIRLIIFSFFLFLFLSFCLLFFFFILKWRLVIQSVTQQG